MAFAKERLEEIYGRTDGRCHICHKKLSFTNYGRPGERGAWEVEHSVAFARGGTGHKNNLYPACITCNRQKGTFTSRTARAWHGNERAPLSKERRAQIARDSAIGGAAIGAILGLGINPAAALLGAGLGALCGLSMSPNK